MAGLAYSGNDVHRPTFWRPTHQRGIFNDRKKFPAFVSLDQWKTFKTATWWIFLCLSVVNVYGGACLSAGKYCYFVKQAKIILWITGPASYFVFGILLPKIVLGEFGTLDGEWTGGFIASIIVASIWTVYLSRSKRVRNTYYW